MFNFTLIGAARVWFDELPPESIDGYKGLKAAFLANFMQQKKYVKDPVEIHNIKQRDGETIEEFMERFKIETGHLKGAPECIRIFGFMHGVNNPELTKRLNKYVPKTMEEMMTATTTFIQGETTVASKKKVHTPWKSQDQSKRHTSERLRKQIEELRMTRQKVTQSFTRVKEIMFPPLTANKGMEGPLVIEAEIGGHAVHRMYVDGGSSMELKLLVTIGDAEHSMKAWTNFMIVRSLSPYNGIIRRPGIREIQAVPSTAHGMLKFPVNGRIVTIRSTILMPTEYATIAATPKDSVKKAKARYENFKVAIHPDLYCYTKMPTKAITKYRWQNKMRKNRLSTSVTRQDGGRVAAPIPTDNQRGPEPQWEAS
ncbi:reverse transcriptase domain-containing protein [Tanacetum coccineum]